MAKRGLSSKLDKIAKYGLVAFLVATGSIMQMRWVAENAKSRPKYKKVENVKRYKCSHCDGEGRVPFFLDPSELRECPVCFAAGSRLVKVHPEFQQICPSCLGMGRLYNSSTHHAITCFTCTGRGATLMGYLVPGAATNEPHGAINKGPNNPTPPPAPRPDAGVPANQFGE